MASLKNWDNKTWLSSQNYINSFNKFLLKQVKLDKNSRILDIGCGRGKIIANLTFKLKSKEISNGVNENKRSFKRNIKFLDVLICLRYTKY